ncbi:unnamed protein product, partial [Meganyctiphanes norvegica]
MAWLCRGIILLLGLLSQTDYVQPCDDDCKDDLVQKFQNLLNTQLDSKMEQIIMKIDILTELMEECKGPSNTTTQQLNDILESTEEMDQNGMKTDSVTGSSLITLSNEVEGCPEGFIEMSSQCFKMFRDRRRKWKGAKRKCKQEGLILAQPDDSVAVQLRQKLYETYGDGNVHLGARGNGRIFKYAHGGRALHSWSPLWIPGYGSYMLVTRCLLLLVDGHHLRDKPARPYYPSPCEESNFALCE